MNRLLARLVAMFRRRPVARPLLQFRQPDGQLNTDALTTHIFDFWKGHRDEMHYQLAVLVNALRLLVPGLYALHWDFEQEYDDTGYFQTICDIALKVRLADGREVSLGLPDYGDLLNDEFEYWHERDVLFDAIDAELGEGEDIDDEQRDARFYARLAQDFGLVGVRDEDALKQLGGLVASIIDFARSIDTAYTGVPDEALALAPLPRVEPPSPPASSLPAAA